MPTEITNRRIYASELLDFESAFPAEGQALVVGSTGRLEGANIVTSVNSKTGDIVLTAADIGLGNVDNTSDADKPISTATQAALDTKADASALMAHVEADDNPHDVSAAQVGAYTTAQVDALISAITYNDVGAAAAEHLHTIGDVTGLQTALDAKADASVLSSHVGDTNNPHEVTAAQVGAYTTDEVDGLISAITYSDVGAAAAEHSHTISDITGLQTALDGKLSTSGGSVSYLDLSGFLASARLISGMVSLEGIGFSAGVLVRNTADTADLALQAGALRTSEIYVGFTPSEIKIKYGVIDAPDIRAGEFREASQPLRERYVRHFLNLESKDDLTTLDAAIGDQATVRTGDANDPIHRYELVGESLMSGPEVDYTDLGQPEGWPVSFSVRAPEGWPGPDIVKLEWVAAREVWEWVGNGGDLIASCSINVLNKLDIMFLDLSDIGPPGFRTTDVLTWPPPNDSLTVASSPMGWDMSTVVFLNQSYDTPAQNLANWRRIVTLDADGEIKGPILHRFVLDTDDTDVARIGEIVCVVDDLDNPTTVSYRMGDGTTKTANLPEIATVTP